MLWMKETSARTLGLESVNLCGRSREIPCSIEKGSALFVGKSAKKGADVATPNLHTTERRTNQ